MNNEKNKFLYEKIVGNISNQIHKGILKPLDRLPTVRKLSKDLGISISTVLLAYSELERNGYIQSKVGSGHYVRSRPQIEFQEPNAPSVEAVIRKYTNDDLVLNIHEQSNIPGLISLGAGVPSEDILPTKKLNRIQTSILRHSESAGILYEFPPGYYKLRLEIAKRMAQWNVSITPDDIIITSGAVEAITLALKAICKPGDTIITESPTYYILLQQIQNLGMKILEVPTNPRDGIEINALKKVLSKHNISACVLYPTINNPSGSVMSDGKKETVYDLLSSKDIPIIEGDVWGELYFNKPRPKPIKSFDKKGLVLYFSSFSKTGLPGYRIGWITPGKYFKSIKGLKYMYSMSTSTLSQITIAEFIRCGAYDKCLENLRKIYNSRLSLLLQFISEYFPKQTKIVKPRGGAFLWIELPKTIDSIELYNQALVKKISIAPGVLFSTRKDLSNYIRLSAACKWDNLEIESAIKTLGELCKGFL